MQRPSIKHIFLLIFIIISLNTKGQNRSADLAMIGTYTPSSSLPDHSYDHSKKKVKFIQAINPLYWTYRGGIAFYQSYISSQLSTSCIYETSCSRFSKKLFTEYSIFKGFFLSADRITRCNRITYSDTSPLSINKEGKVIEDVRDFTFKNE
jgi:putative component of membrane protein insertase Oxa1/YidC/SpoIIIJ protein YidD